MIRKITVILLFLLVIPTLLNAMMANVVKYVCPWGMVKILIVVLPILYAVVWNEKSNIYFTDSSGKFFK